MRIGDFSAERTLVPLRFENHEPVEFGYRWQWLAVTWDERWFRGTALTEATALNEVRETLSYAVLARRNECKTRVEAVLRLRAQVKFVD
jgi:hypothetical protein